MTGDPELELVGTEAELERLAPEWRRLHGESRPLNPFLSYEWTAACWRRLAGRSTPFVVACREGSRLIGVAPLHVRRRGPFRVLRFIGEGLSDALGFLCAPDRSPVVARFLLEHLESLSSSWDVAVLRPVPEAGAQWLSVAVPGLRGAQAAGPAAPYLSLVRGWDELLSAGPPQLRHTRRRVRRFEREGGTIARLPGPDAAREFGQLVEIEARSWKTPAGVSWSGSAAIRAVLQAALETVGGAEVWLARVGSRPVGYLMNFVAADRSLFYQGAYDPDYRTLYPGGVLHYSAIQAACAAGRREYDFLNGAEEYKGGWTSGTRQTRYLSLNPVSARGRAAFAALVTPTWFLRRFAVAHSFRSVTRRWVAQHDGRRP